jgi:ribosomal protein L11 methyltransferase
LTRLAGSMRQLLAPNARVVLSGLLANQENAALAAYRARGLKLVRRIPLGEWVTLVLARQADAPSPSVRSLAPSLREKRDHEA